LPIQLLRRSLKPKEEVVRDIAADYQENGIRLLDNLHARHVQEKDGMMATLHKASRETFSLFAGASQDMAILINELRDMDAAHTAEKLTRPVLTQKLDAVAQLCQSRLDNYTQTGPLEDAPESDADDTLDGLSATYRTKLLEAVRRVNDASETSGVMNSEIDEFVRRCLHGETKNVRHARAKKPEEPTRNADDALEVFLDGIMSNLQEKEDGGGIVRIESGLGVASEDSDMVDIDILG
jgi:hypothetical protein